jgi:hypothetical protein
MTAVLICSHAEDLKADLGATLLWRNDVERRVVTKMDEARMLAVAARPSIVVVDRDLPWAGRVLAALRDDATTRGLSMVVMARGDFDPSEVELLEAGANAILRLPAGPEWNSRLERLMAVPVRKDARFPVSFDVQAAANGGRPEQAQALNLSASGMLLETSGTLEVRDEIQLRFALPPAPSPLRVSGQVVRVAAPTRFGVEFCDVGPEESRRLQGYLQTLGS